MAYHCHIRITYRQFSHQPLTVTTDILIIAANYGFALCLSAHDKWNKQATFPFMSPHRAIRSNFRLPVMDLKKIKAKS